MAGNRIINLGGAARALGQRMVNSLYSSAYGTEPALIRDIPANAWPNPLQPIPPFGPEGSEPLTWNFWEGQNLNYTPRSDAAFTADELRALSMYPLARMCIDNVKDIVCGTEWQISLKPLPGETNSDRAKRAKGDENIVNLTRFFEYPDGRTDWATWSRMLVENMLTIDAGSVLVERSKRGKVSGLEVIRDGGSVTCYIDERGRTPDPPSVAYSLNWWGLPRTEHSTDELVYGVRNIVPRNTISSFLYGLSPCESIAEEIKIGIQRLNFVLAYYSSGSVPDAIQIVPPGTPPDKVKEAYQANNAALSGQLSQRRKWTLLQGFQTDGKADQILFPKEPLLSDPFDEMHIRKVCYAFGDAPQRLMKQMNRSCHSIDTETLTENGWKFYDQIADGEKIAQYDPNTGGFEFVVPEDRYIYPYSGEMVRFKSQNVDVLVTPEHKMWVSKKNNRKKAYSPYRKIPAGQISGGDMRFAACAVHAGREQEEFEIPAVKNNQSKLALEQLEEIWAGGYTDSYFAHKFDVTSSAVLYARKRHGSSKRPSTVPPLKVKMDDWLEFLGYFLSEGGLSHAKKHYLLTLSQKDKSNAAKIEECLSRLPFSWKRYPEQEDGMTRWNVYGKQLCDYLMKATGGYCFNKRIPRQFLDLSSRQLQILFDALMLGDGSWSDPGRTGTYPSTSKQLANDVQELVFRLGYNTAVRFDRRDDRPYKSHPHSPMNVVSICSRETHNLARPYNFKREHYEGPVWCFKVPTGLFVTRRNGKIGIHGNSSESSQTAAEEEGIAPWVKWLSNLINRIIAFHMKMPEYQISFKMVRESDVIKLMQADVGYVKNGGYTWNERRDLHGDDPRPEPEANELGIITANGWLAIGQTLQPAPGMGKTVPSSKKLRVVQRGETAFGD